MLDEVKPDLVSIGRRWLDQHRDIVVETANRGVHIYLEKPLCCTLAEADQMADALNRDTKLVIAHTTRHSPKTKVVQTDDCRRQDRPNHWSSAAAARKISAAAAKTCGCSARTSWT